MSENKFKIGDRVKDREGNEGVVVDFADSINFKVYQPNFGDTLWYTVGQLTLIERPTQTADTGRILPPQPNEKVYTIEDAVKHIEENFEHYSSDIQNLKMAFRGEMLRVLRFHNRFNPETLEFDGKKIGKDDQVEVNDVKYLVYATAGDGRLCILYNDEYYLPLAILNITAHYPKQSGLEEEIRQAEEAMQLHANNMFNGNHQLFDDYKESENAFNSTLDRYFQARKRLEDIKNGHTEKPIEC